MSEFPERGYGSWDEWRERAREAIKAKSAVVHVHDSKEGDRWMQEWKKRHWATPGQVASRKAVENAARGLP